MKRTLIALFLFITLTCHSQNWEWITNQVNIEHNADPNKAIIFDLWKSFVDAHDDSTALFPQWNKADNQQWEQPDFICSEGFLTSSLYAYLNKVLEIRNEGDAYIIRSLFYTPYNDDKAIFVLAITNHVAMKENNGEFKLYNWIDYYTRRWRHKTVGLIDYIYYPGFPFNKRKALAANELIRLLQDNFDVKLPHHITQYIAPTLYDQQKMKGFDYVIGMSDVQGNSGGSFDRKNYIIYGDSAHGENYQHEIARLLNPQYPHAPFLIIQGLSEYVNSSQKQFRMTHQQHFLRMNEWLSAHPEADLSNMDDPFYTMDNQTAPAYLIGMVVCHELYQKGGFNALKRALAAGEDDANFYAFLQSEIGIGQDKFNQWMREKVETYATQAIPPLK